MADQRRPAGDDELAGLVVPDQRQGPVERAVRRSVEDAQLDDRDEGAGELAAACGRAVDLAHNRRDPYAVAAAARELRECLQRLRLDPVSRQGSDAGELQTWLQGLAEAT